MQLFYLFLCLGLSACGKRDDKSIEKSKVTAQLIKNNEKFCYWLDAGHMDPDNQPFYRKFIDENIAELEFIQEQTGDFNNSLFSYRQALEASESLWREGFNKWSSSYKRLLVEKREGSAVAIENAEFREKNATRDFEKLCRKTAADLRYHAKGLMPSEYDRLASEAKEEYEK